MTVQHKSACVYIMCQCSTKMTKEFVCYHLYHDISFFFNVTDFGKRLCFVFNLLVEYNSSTE